MRVGRYERALLRVKRALKEQRLARVANEPPANPRHAGRQNVRSAWDKTVPLGRPVRTERRGSVTKGFALTKRDLTPDPVYWPQQGLYGKGKIE